MAHQIPSRLIAHVHPITPVPTQHVARKPIVHQSAVACPTAPTVHLTAVQSPAEVQAVVSRLAEGFKDENTAMLLGGPTNSARLVRAFALATLADLDASQSLFHIDDASCVALCFEYPYNEAGLATQLLRGSLLSILFAMRPQRWGTFFKLLAKSKALHDRFLKEHGRHLYLQAISTVPWAQGKGLGGKMLEALAARADAKQLPLYLEASSEGSRALYARRGFLDIDTLVVMPGDLDSFTIYRMWRPPQQPSAPSTLPIA